MNQPSTRATLTVVLALGLCGCFALDDLAPLEPAVFDGGADRDAFVADEGDIDDDACADELFVRDDDGDGYGVGGTTRCGASFPFTARVDGDCNDDDDRVNPGAQEACNNIDDDCDDEIDEGVLNECGGCGDLPVNLGDSCSVQTCEWSCVDGVPGPACTVPGGDFACGACSTWTLGQPCGTCGTTACSSGAEPAFVVCVDAGPNACGGCEPLAVQPGRSCGGGNEEYLCTGPNSVECSG